MEYKEMASPGPNQLDSSRFQQILRVGDSIEGENPFVGVGRGSPVSSYDDVIVEQPRDFKNEIEADTGSLKQKQKRKLMLDLKFGHSMESESNLCFAL